MSRRIPSWTGMLFSVVGLAGVLLPFLELGGYPYSLFQIFCEIGHREIAWGNLVFMSVMMLASLFGRRMILLCGGEMLLWEFVNSAAGVASVIGVKQLLRCMAVGGWCCFAASTGLFLNFLLSPLDRRIFHGLLAWWQAEGSALQHWETE